MRKTTLVLIVFISIFSLSAGYKFSASFDVASAQDMVKKNNIQINGDLRLDIYEGFEIRLPVTYTKTTSEWMADAGLFIHYYPFSKGLFFGISAVDFAYRKQSFIAMNEINAGWTFNLFKNMFIEPEIVIRDPSGTYKDEYSDIRATFPSYSTIRFRLLAGYKFKEKK